MDVNTLLKLNVNEHTEKKGNLTYLSWAWAWAEALKADPAATFKVEMFGMYGDKCYIDINGTAMVWVTVTMFNKPMMCQLPVMDHRNKPITNPDAFAVNTAIMRCMTKALSLHGLGLYIYAGEDLPESDTKAEPSLEEKIADAIRDLHTKGDEVGMYGEWESIADNEVRLSVWAILKPDTKVRSAIKAFKEKLESTESK
jgi:Protein of unknown function (DUF1071)